MDQHVCWIASYPKSGNTWVRFLLHQYFFGRADRSESIADSIPDVHVRSERFAGRSIGRLMLAKTHHRLTASMPHRDRTACAIYVVRHPRDVMWSALNYTKLISTPEIASSISDHGYMRNFIHLGGDPLYIQYGFGSIIEHVGSWTAHPTLPVHVVRYEDLRLDPCGALRSMLEFLGQEADEGRIEAAVADSSFERLRALEREEKGAGVASPVFAGSAQGADHGLRFMNAATHDRSLDQIAPGLDEIAEQRFSWILRRFGYETRSSQSRARSTAS